MGKTIFKCPIEFAAELMAANDASPEAAYAALIDAARQYPHIGSKWAARVCLALSDYPNDYKGVQS